MVLFSHFTVLLPSDALSQKHDAAVCNPAPAIRIIAVSLPADAFHMILQAQTLPFFCIMTVVTTYLNGLFRSANRLMQVSRQVDVH